MTKTLGVFALSFVLQGCATNSEHRERPLLVHANRAPAAQAPLIDIVVQAQFCADRQFHLEAAPQMNRNSRQYCVALAADTMQAPTPIQVQNQDQIPHGNFVDYLLENALNHGGSSFKDFPMNEEREYFVRGGQCAAKNFFTVEPAANARNLNPRDVCRLEQPQTVRSRLPLSGVYPRVAGETLQSFLVKLQSRANEKP